MLPLKCVKPHREVQHLTEVRWLGGALKNVQLSVLSQPLCAPERDCVLDWEWDLKNCWLTANCCILIACEVYYFTSCSSWPHTCHYHSVNVLKTLVKTMLLQRRV